jgi:hypothetical protein
MTIADLDFQTEMTIADLDFQTEMTIADLDFQTEMTGGNRKMYKYLGAGNIVCLIIICYGHLCLKV